MGGKHVLFHKRTTHSGVTSLGLDNRKVLTAIISKKNGINGLSCYILSIFDGLETI